MALPLHQANLLLRQAIQRIHQPVDLPVGGFELALEHGLETGHGRFGHLPVQGQHALDQADHALVAGRIRGVAEVDGRNQAGAI